MENYRITSNLGAGSFGSVWKAVDRKTGRVAAIKKLKKRYKSLEECIRLREVQALVAVSSHPNIVSLDHFIFEKDEFFFVFEHMDNNLHRIIKYKEKDKPLSESEVRASMLQVLQAVEYMHQNGYVHRDLKPENLLVSRDVIKVADLGLAREMVTDPPYTSGVGTLFYQAPEVLLGSSDYGAAVDVWAMGAIMAELFRLGPLFRGRNALDQIHRICVVLGEPTEHTWADGIKMATSMGFRFSQLGPPWPLASFVPKASPEAIDLISSMCSWDPSRRPTASQALQHPFFRNHEPQPVPPLFPRQGCHPSTRSAGVSVPRPAAQPIGNMRFAHHSRYGNVAPQRGALIK